MCLVSFTDSARARRDIFTMFQSKVAAHASPNSNVARKPARRLDIERAILVAKVRELFDTFSTSDRDVEGEND